jgi:hypothetical protein
VSTTKGEGKLCFVFKILNVSPIDLTNEDGDLVRAVSFFNLSKFHGRYFESCRACMTRNGLVLMSCPKVIS